MVTQTTTAGRPGEPPPTASVDTLVQRARNYADDAGTAASDASKEASVAETNRVAAQDAALNARELCDHARHHAAASHAAAQECREASSELREGSRALAGELKNLKIVLEAQAKARASECGDGPRGEHPRQGPPPGPAPGPGAPGPQAQVHTCHGGGRPADEIAASMSQLNTLLLGASPAFAQAMRLQTDAIASGLGVLNAISNQQSHHALELASTARGIVEVHERRSPAGAGRREDPAAK